MLTTSICAAGAAALFLLPVSASAREMTIAADGASAYRIVTPERAAIGVTYAASELQRLLTEMTGVELPILPEDKAGEGPALFLGPTVKAKALGLVEEAKKLGEDGVLIRTVGEDLTLVGGGDRGQLYVVYELLERFLGVRFLASDCTVVPKRDVLTLPEIDRKYASPFEYREELYFEAGDWEHASRLRLNGSNMNQCRGLPNGAGERIPGILICPFVHSAAAMVPPGVYFAEHPEYFGLVNGERRNAVTGGQLCYTNPDVLRICTDWVLKWFEDNPQVTCCDISQNDAYPGDYGACECENCQAIVREEGSQHGPILRFVNAIADVVKERFPDRTVETIAYQYSIDAPKVTKPRDNVIIRLCHHACYFHGIECKPLGEAFDNAVKDWRKIAKDVYVWHYGVNFWSYTTPNPNLESLARDLKYYADNGVNGVMIQGNLQGPCGEMAEFRQYLCAQLLWDPTRDPMTIREEFCDGYYGPSKDEALEFLALTDKFAESITQHIPMNGWHPEDITPPWFVSDGLAILERAHAKAPDDVYRNRIEKLMLPLWVMQLAFPDRFGLAKEDGAALLARAAKVFHTNGMTAMAEWGPHPNVFLAELEKVYGEQ